LSFDSSELFDSAGDNVVAINDTNLVCRKLPQWKGDRKSNEGDNGVELWFASGHRL
jgi:hypothetical protein